MRNATKVNTFTSWSFKGDDGQAGSASYIGIPDMIVTDAFAAGCNPTLFAVCRCKTKDDYADAIRVLKAGPSKLLDQ